MGMEMGPSEGNYIMRVEPWSDKSSDHEISEGLFSLSLALSLFLSVFLQPIVNFSSHCPSSFQFQSSFYMSAILKENSSRLFHHSSETQKTDYLTYGI